MEPEPGQDGKRLYLNNRGKSNQSSRRQLGYIDVLNAKSLSGKASNAGNTRANITTKNVLSLGLLLFN